MLAPVSYHQANSHDRQREDKHESCRAGVDVVVEQVDGEVIAEFPESSLAGIGFLALSPEIHREFEPDKEEETANVTGKVGDAVTVVEHGCAEILSSIAFHMVMFDVVIEVRVPGVTQHGVKQVWEQSIEDPVLGSQDTVHVDVLVLH